MENYTQQDVDYYNDADLAEPKNLPTGVRFIGKIVDVKTDESVPGSYRKLKKTDDHGRTEVPVITVLVKTVCYANGIALDADENYRLTGRLNFQVGPEDRIGRNMLVNMTCAVTGMSKEELRTVSIRDGARRLIGGFVTYEVTISEGEEQTFQNFRKVRAATADEEAAAVAAGA